MKGYIIPAQLQNDIDQLEELMLKFRKGGISAVELKAHRVPFGVYEQRQPDTYMVRIRCPGGIISPGQLEKVSLIAEQFGVKDIHVTSRQELQLHYVKLDDVVGIIRQLKDAGLATRGGGGNTVRNIAAQEDAGIDPKENFDVTPYVLALTSRLIAESDSWNLPRKFKIAFSGSEEDKGYATLADVGFIARIKDGKKGFKVYTAGGLGAKPQPGKLLVDFIPDEDVYPAAEALKKIFYKFGNRKNKHAARLRFLWNSLGEEEFRKKFNEEFAGIKAADWMPLEVEPAAVGARHAVPLQINAEEPANLSDFALWKKRFVRPQKQAGLFSALIPVELGFITAKQSLALARFLSGFGEEVIRMTKDQNFLLRNIPEAYLGNIYNFLKGLLPEINRPAIFGKILSCAGASTCQLGICLSRQAARALIGALEKSGLDLDKIGGIKINISGCPNSCGQHPAADLGFFGRAGRKDGILYPAYNVFCGAVIHNGSTRLAEQAGEAPAKDLPQLVIEFLKVYLSKAGSFEDFSRYIRQEGKEDLKKLCLRYQDVPAFAEDKNYYFDWGADAQFSLAQRRAGECSAGLFDLLEMDLGNIRETKNKLLNPDTDKESKKQLLKELVFYSCRMLLITRGIEPKKEEEAYRQFTRNFVDTGLAAGSLRQVISLAEKKDYPGLLRNEAGALELAKAVELLYENMDNAFNFKKGPEAGEEQPSVMPAAPVKDLRGVACPLNFVKTKVELSKLKPGERLEVWLDDGEPVENVPGSVKAEGHIIVSQKKTDNYWVVIIEKK